MKLHTLIEIGLREGIEVHSERLLAYAAVVAELYDAAPVNDPAAKSAYDALNASNQRLKQIKSHRVNYEPTPNDPYTDEHDMAAQVGRTGTMRTYSGHSDHPEMSGDKTVDFRTVHDLYGHMDPTNSATGNRFRTHGFNLRGEFNSYVSHVRMVPREAIPALFTEIVGQTSYATIMGGFPTQKAAILHGVDYIRVGVVTDQRLAARMDQIDAFLRDPDQKKFALNLNGQFILDKTKINWAGLGTSARQRLSASR